MSSSIVERVAEKLGSRKKAVNRISLNQNNTYIFPTIYGFGFLVLLILMLVAAINYQNSLIYICIFFLGSIFFVSIWMCFLNVASLEVFSTDSEGVFEGEGAKFKLGFQKKKSPVFGLLIGFNSSDMEYISISESEVLFHEILIYGLKRGVHQSPKIRLESTFPFGFIRAWTWLRLDVSSLVYPRPEYSPVSSGADMYESEKPNERLGGAEKDLLREYSEGEPLNRICWKKFAATDQLFVLDDAKVSSNPTVVNWNDYEGSSVEDRLRYMCFRICELYEKGAPFGLVLPGQVIQPGYSRKQLKTCLRVLAEY